MEVVEIDMSVLREVMGEVFTKIEKKHNKECVLAFVGGIVLTLIVVKLVS